MYRCPSGNRSHPISRGLSAGGRSRVRKKDFCGPVQLRKFRTLDKKWLLSLTSLPLGETRVREQAAENPFFRGLLIQKP